jgi:hypothetical protein
MSLSTYWLVDVELAPLLRVYWDNSGKSGSGLFLCGVGTHQGINEGPTEDDVASGGGGEPGYNEGVEVPEAGIVGAKADHECHRQPTAYEERESRYSDWRKKSELNILPSETMARKAMMTGKM